MEKPKRKQSLLSSLNAESLQTAHKQTTSMASKLKSENHKGNKPTIIPESYIDGNTLPIRFHSKIHTELKVAAARTGSDIQTKANEAVYNMLVAEGFIKPE